MGHSTLPLTYSFSVEKASHPVVGFVEGKPFRKFRAWHERYRVSELMSFIMCIIMRT
ncbi:uncharacterized protein STEHIDRAFT_122367, partial [Stereum hirsutum FP-91666 SS1]|uniref:uncharacterized protein n=1 Tax=Stereum hirsutum (strain FP-91666) TaxID=721885 RepID=UPI000444A230